MQFVVKSLLIATFLLLGGCAATGADPGERIQISEADGRYRFSVPASRLVMTTPRRGWSVKKNNNIGGGTSSPRYFYLENKADHYILSGWFEPDRLFTSARQLWKEESEKQQKGGMPVAVNVTYAKFGGWDTVMYDYVIGKATSSHIRGHWVQSGTWIDVHISTTTEKTAAENRKNLKALLNDISVTTRNRS